MKSIADAARALLENPAHFVAVTTGYPPAQTGGKLQDWKNAIDADFRPGL
jgi:hypothetical protein